MNDHETKSFYAGDDFSSIELADIDKMENAAVKEALQSVLRKGQLPQFHKDHGSHSNTP